MGDTKVQSEKWRERLANARKNGKFSPRDHAEAVLANRGPAEELGMAFDLRVRQGHGSLPTIGGKNEVYSNPVYFAGCDGLAVLPGAAFADAVRRDDPEAAEAILTKMEEMVQEWVNRGAT